MTMKHSPLHRLLAPLSMAIALTFPATAWTHDEVTGPANGSGEHGQATPIHRAVAAEPASWPRHAGAGRMARQIGLGPEQQASIRALVERARPASRALREEIRDNRLELMATPTDGPDYDAVVQRVAESNGRLTSELIRHHAQLRAEVQALMTPEQREQARTITQERRSRMEQRIERRLSGAGDILF